jgi:hypothetical protein
MRIMRLVVLAAWALLGLLPVQSVLAAGMLEGLRSVLQIKAIGDRCWPAMVSSGELEALPDVDPVLTNLKAAMLENARLLRTEVSEAVLSDEISAYVDEWIAEAGIAFGDQPPCSPELGAQLVEAVEQLSSPAVQEAMLTAARSLRPYDELQPFAEFETSARTYAYPEIQSGLLGTAVAKCPQGFAISDATVIAREPQGPSDGQPPFVLPPVRYVEHWSVSCGENKQRLEVEWRQDSEGHLGIWKITEHAE